MVFVQGLEWGVEGVTEGLGVRVAEGDRKPLEVGTYAE